MPTLEWIGKRYVVNFHRKVPFHLIQQDDKFSLGDSGTGNLLVQGDNLLALKALLPYYAQQVKCVYIDPPYNTGNEGWVYNDAVNSAEMRDWLGKVVGKEAEDLSRHDKWLCMMYPRLQLLHQFLRKDGVIMVSIDDNEVASLRMIMDEIFGPRNFVACLSWEKGKKGDSKLISVTHEYIVIYAFDKAGLLASGTKWRRKKPGIDIVFGKYHELKAQYGDDISTIEKEIRSWFKSLPNGHPAKAHKHYKCVDKKGLYFPDNFAGPDDGRDSRPRYDIIHPATGKPCKKPSTGWRWEEATTLDALSQDPPRIHFGKDHTTIPCRKSYLEEIDKEPFTSVFYKDGRAATLELEQMIGPKKFDFPKDVDVLADLIGLVTEPDDIILDSFTGSGTTGQAVLKLNQSDNGSRKFILVEMDENTCTNVTLERLKCCIEGYIPKGKKKGQGEVTSGTGGGVQFCRLGNPLFNSDGEIASDVGFQTLAQHIFFVETGLPLPNQVAPGQDLLGVVDGVAVYLLFNDKNCNQPTVLNIEALAKLAPYNGQRVVYADSCIVSDSALKRAKVIFKQIPYEVKVN